MCLHKILPKKNYSGLVEGADLIFRIVCQVSGQDNVSYKSENCIGKRLLSKYLFYRGFCAAWLALHG